MNKEFSGGAVSAVTSSPNGPLEAATAILVEALRTPLTERRLEAIYKFPLDESLTSLVKALKSSQQDNKPSDFAALPQDTNQDLLKRIETLQDFSNQSLFDQTLALRKTMHSFLQDNQSYRRPIARWIVRVWGKVDRNDRANYESLVEEAEQADPIKAFRNWKYDRIAQWSKYVAFRHPSEAAVYDARVVYSLNWFLRQAIEIPLFPRLPSQNRLVSLLDYTLLNAVHRMGWSNFERHVENDIEAIESGAAQRSGILRMIEPQKIRRQDAYGYYMQLLKGAAKVLFPGDDWGVTQIEMMLFGMATTHVARQVLEQYARLGSRADP